MRIRIRKRPAVSDEQLAARFPYAGAVGLVRAFFSIHGEPLFLSETIRIYEAVCRLEAAERGMKPEISLLAEAMHYTSYANLRHLAEYGIALRDTELFNLVGGNHAISIRATAVLEVLSGKPPRYRDLLQAHDVFSGKPPFMRYDREVNHFIARRTQRA